MSDEKQKVWDILKAPPKQYYPWKDPTVMTIDVFFQPVHAVEYINLEFIIKNES